MSVADKTATRSAVAVPEAAEQSGDGADPEPRRAILVDIVADAGDWTAFSDAEKDIAAAVHAVEMSPEAVARLPAAYVEVVVVLSSDEAVATLNGQFRGKPKPTNVLSFPAPAAKPQVSNLVATGLDAGVHPAQLGDIVLAAETIAREAAELAIPPRHHLMHLVVHGALHLLGYDHIDDDEAAAMEALETQVLATLSIPDPYAGSDPLGETQ